MVTFANLILFTTFALGASITSSCFATAAIVFLSVLLISNFLALSVAYTIFVIFEVPNALLNSFLFAVVSLFPDAAETGIVPKANTKIMNTARNLKENLFFIALPLSFTPLMQLSFQNRSF